MRPLISLLPDAARIMLVKESQACNSEDRRRSKVFRLPAGKIYFLLPHSVQEGSPVQPYSSGNRGGGGIYFGVKKSGSSTST
jgi:hypothetical protein